MAELIILIAITLAIPTLILIVVSWGVDQLSDESIEKMDRLVFGTNEDVT